MNLLKRISQRFYAQAAYYEDKAQTSPLHQGLAESMKEYGELFDPDHPRIYTAELALLLVVVGVITVLFVF